MTKTPFPRCDSRLAMQRERGALTPLKRAPPRPHTGVLRKAFLLASGRAVKKRTAGGSGAEAAVCLLIVSCTSPKPEGNLHVLPERYFVLERGAASPGRPAPLPPVMRGYNYFVKLTAATVTCCRRDKERRGGKSGSSPPRVSDSER
ncbi:hypothetical protein E2C01_042959 [Portunus trituberculatus]|uniref:Uncharacterized protein n=1 Tax=Portunus trituberculatus TaxID=210409 RepID=A0A5B7FXX9_PORTR|nr:hypothetical protein [Portunus trituberculatus]